MPDEGRRIRRRLDAGRTGVYWVTTISSYLAYYYMAMFYSGVHRQLLAFKPDLKFITFNSTMYYTYWQKVWMVFFQNRLMACFDHQTPVFYSKRLMYCIEVPSSSSRIC